MNEDIVVLFNIFTLLNKRQLQPISRQFGFDRGTPIDRYYIDNFLNDNKLLITNDVLEVADFIYTKKFGADRVKKSIILDMNADYSSNYLIANLETGEGIVESICDCFICTQTLCCIYDVKSAIKNALRLLKRKGTLLVTVSGITQVSRYDMKRWGHYWSFTDLSLRKLFEEFMPREHIKIKTYGNVRAASAFLYGLSAEELSSKELEYHDPDYPLLVAGVIEK